MGNNVMGPQMIDVLGVQAPALSLIVGLISVILIRVMLLSREGPTTPKTTSWWMFNVTLTFILCLIVFIIILDRNLGPGLSLIIGIGTGALGITIVDIFKDKAQKIIEALRA